MKKIVVVVCLLPILSFAQEISIYGNRGMFKLQYAQPHNMGMFSFHLAPEERFESFDVMVQGQSTTDRIHYFQITTGLSYAITDFWEMRFHAAPFMKWYEANDYPVERGDPYPPIGFKTLEIGTKWGHAFIMNEATSSLYAIGLDACVDFGPGLSKDFFSNAWHNDSAFYADTICGVVPNIPPHIPHSPDYKFTGLFDLKLGPFATHLNIGYLITGEDNHPGYVDPADLTQRPNYVVHGIGIQLIPSDAARILFEAYGMFDTEQSAESLWVTPGLRFGSKSVSFDLGCEIGIVNPTDQDLWWKAFINFSVGTDLAKEARMPIVTGRVYDAKTKEPIAAILTFPGSDKEAIKASEIGAYKVTLTPGSYRIHAEAPDYRWKDKGIVLKEGDQVVLDFDLNKKPVAKIIGKIYDIKTKAPIVAEITFPQTELPAINSDTTGMYNVRLEPGTYRLHVEATDYQFSEEIVTIKEDETKVVDIALTLSGEQATLTGMVSDAETGKALLAEIAFVETHIPIITTDATTGIYKVTVPAGTYSVKVNAQDYIPEYAPVVLAKDETKIHNFKLRPIPKVGEKIILKGIYFDFNSAVIKPESYAVLDDASKVLKAKPKMRVEISGHTDSIGSDTYNQKLSNQRANAVRDYMIRYHNIDPSRLVSVGYGETHPIADNRTKSGRDTNRRIEFKILSW